MTDDDRSEHVRWPDAGGFFDWRGTAVMLEDIANGASFEQLADLDPLQWAVIAVDLKTGTAPGARTGLVLYALDLTGFDIRNLTDRRRVLADAANRGSLRVRQFVCDHLGLSDVLAQMKTAHVHFRAQPYHDVDLYT